jgi:flagellar hook-length control protein FliK
MVAAATQLPIALGPSPANAASPDAPNATANPGSDIADNEFMQLLSTLIKPESSATNQSGTATGEKPDKDSTANSDSPSTGYVDVSTWLITPALINQNPQTPVTQDVASDEIDDALTPVSNGVTNALLAQRLKQFDNKSTDAAVKAETGNDKSDMSSFINKDAAAQSPLDLMLKTVESASSDSALRPVDKDVQRVDSDNGTAPPNPLTTTPHAVVNDVGDRAVHVKIESRVDSRQWADDIGTHLSAMVANKTHSASLQLTPDNLGPVQVKIEVNSNQANVWFTADHPDTRTALEQSLPRLRELFASQGMSLMDAGVFGHGAQQQAPMFSRNAQPSYGMTDMSTDVTSTQVILKVGLLDTYA